MNRDFETLSAFLDGETNDFETRRVLRDLDPGGLDVLARWQLARDVMHGQATMAVPASFNAHLSQALAAETKVPRRSGMVSGFARVAVAASVAAVTVIGWQYWSVPTEGMNAEVVAANDSTDAAPTLAAEQRVSRPFGETALVSLRPNQTRATPATVDTEQPRVNAMLLRHSEFAARHSGQGMMPYARLISLDARDGAR